jgi:putative drug exporter of the RND superfamily
MFQSVSEFVVRRRRAVMAIWVAVIVAGLVAGGGVMSRLSPSFDGDASMESVQVMERLEELGFSGLDAVAIVEGDADDPAVRSDVEAAADDIAAIDGVTSVMTYWSTGLDALVSTDGTSSIVVVSASPHVAEDEVAAVADAVVERLHDIDAGDVTVGGAMVISEEFREAAEKDLQRGEAIALPIALVAMVVIFGGVLAAGLPLLVALSSVLVSMIVLLGATGVMDVSVFSINVVTMLGIGLGIDYGLLVVSRFREERAAGLSVEAAVERTVVTAGSTVAFSALTVAVALSGLFVFEDAVFRSFGVAGIGVVLISMAAAVTLLPAVLASTGHRIKPAPVRTGTEGFFFRLSQRVQRRAVPVVVIVGVGLATLAAPFLGANFENGDARSLPRSSESRAVALRLADEYPSHGADPLTVIADVDPAAPELTAWTEDLAARPDVADVSVRSGTPAGVSVIDVVPAGGSQDDAAQALAMDLRAQDLAFDTQVGGTAASLIDFKDSILERLPYALAVIALATFVLLFLMTGSVAVPIKAIVMNLLSLGASFGGLIWVFQDGHLSGLLGFDPIGSVDTFMPVLIFIFAFGLSMDYEVFLLSRIKEVYDETGDNDLSVSIGLQRSGRIITSAAFLIVVVFAGFAAGEVLTIKQLGFGLALAVIVDATIVRSLLVPATMRLLGDWNWWAPAPLRRIHQRWGISEGHAAPAPEPTPEAIAA